MTKRSTRRRAMRDHQQIHVNPAREHQARMTTIHYGGRFLVSAAQGSPEQAAAIIALLAGTAFKLASVIAQLDDMPGPIKEIGKSQVLDYAGTGLYAIAAVDEVGVLAHAAADILGKSRPLPVYNLGETLQSESVVYSNGGGGSTFRLG